ncbi:LacI family DNA-binding transcriptional regulator [Nonomuraea zeae]|uniref:LacI family transcriptional regulator n=1 Tax=Nonomuraea zeae TaxID=1642303 RepID=A0A5S4GFK2_9ACTN|nr:LacI family DNA-binding transcriptional regulator [Nonomuraea zeae]TMR31735.1 LacI family transcriptional regulator [Nonomuraea zeae]
MTRPAKRITSSDVARAAGVSRATVSFVLNDRPGLSITQETRRRVLEAAQRLDYRPHASARSLAAGRSDVVLLSIPDLPIGAGISRFVEELATALAAYGLTLVTHLAGAHGRPLPDVCASVDASAVIGFDPFDHDTIQALYRAGARVVIPAGADMPASTGHIGRAQADHLIGRGHRRLGYAAPGHAGFREMARERLRGVTDACAEAGIDPPVVLTTTLEIASAAQAVSHWAERSVTGVCTFNDETAIAVLAGLHHHGLSAPADLAVIGADDIPTARLTAPPLTTVCYDLHQAGRQRAEAVVAGLSGHQLDVVALTPAVPQVVQRSST